MVQNITVGGSYRFQGVGGPYKLTSWNTTVYFNDAGDLKNDNVYVHLYANHIKHVNTGVYYNIEMTLNGKLDAIPNIGSAYLTPTMSISTTQTISIYNQSRSVSVAKNNSGDSNATTAYLKVNNKDWFDTGLGNNSGNATFTPSDYEVGDAATYKVKGKRVHSKDSTKSVESNELELYTYRTPIMESVAVSHPTISGRGTGSITWITNGRYWGSKTEADFKTYMKFKSSGDWFALGSDYQVPNDDNQSVRRTVSMNITKSFILSRLTDTQKNNDSYKTKFIMRRKNETSGVVKDSADSVDNGTEITIQLKPTSKPENIAFYDWSDTKPGNKGASIASGSKLYIDEHPYLLVTWTYPNLVDNGQISGYEVIVYKDSSKASKKTTFIVNTVELSGSQKMNIETELNRRTMNYIGIKAFYKSPDNTLRYGPEEVVKFVAPMGRLHKPVIEYPVNGTTWHNKNFRILLQNPKDDDFDTLRFSRQYLYLQKYRSQHQWYCLYIVKSFKNI